jgi:glutamine synthetase
MENALELAEQIYVNVNIHDKENVDRVKSLAKLHDSYVGSADCLEKQRAVCEEHDVFSPAMIDGIIAQLRSFNDSTLRADISNNHKAIKKLVDTYFHCG